MRHLYGAAGNPNRTHAARPPGQSWDVDTAGFPAGRDTELLVEGGGVFQGRYLMTPGPSTRPTAEQRLLALALADQVGVALATSHPVTQD